MEDYFEPIHNIFQIISNTISEKLNSEIKLCFTPNYEEDNDQSPGKIEVILPEEMTDLRKILVLYLCDISIKQLCYKFYDVTSETAFDELNHSDDNIFYRLYKIYEHYKYIELVKLFSKLHESQLREIEYFLNDAELQKEFFKKIKTLDNAKTCAERIDEAMIDLYNLTKIALDVVEKQTK